MGDLRIKVFMTIISVLISGFCLSQEKVMPVLRGAYFGQELNGENIEPFLPEVFSTKGVFEFHLHSSLYFTPDGKEVFFTNQKLPVISGYDQTIMFMEGKDGQWSEPKTAPFSGKYSDQIFFISPDGNRIYFTSTRPLSGEGDALDSRNGWIVERDGKVWSEPRQITSPADLKTDDGTLYVSARFPGGAGGNDVYRLKFENGNYSLPENAGPPVNTEYDEYACCAPEDESFLIYYRFKTDDKIKSGLYLCFSNGDNTWKTPISLSEKWDLSFGFSASLSPNGRYLFVLDRGNGIYWIDAEAIKKLQF